MLLPFQFDSERHASVELEVSIVSSCVDLLRAEIFEPRALCDELVLHEVQSTSIITDNISYHMIIVYHIISYHIKYDIISKVLSYVIYIYSILYEINKVN